MGINNVSVLTFNNFDNSIVLSPCKQFVMRPFNAQEITNYTHALPSSQLLSFANTQIQVTRPISFTLISHNIVTMYLRNFELYDPALYLVTKDITLSHLVIKVNICSLVNHVRLARPFLLLPTSYLGNCYAGQLLGYSRYNE